MARASARYPSLRFEGPCFIGPDVRFEVREGYGRLVVGAYTHFGAHARVRAHEGTLRIGAKSVIGIRNTINCWLDISIGAGVPVRRRRLHLRLRPRARRRSHVPIKDQGIVKSPVRIGDDVWLGTKVVVTRGTDIGDHCVVAASAVARGVYPPRSVVAGIPGKVVRTRTEARARRVGGVQASRASRAGKASSCRPVAWPRRRPASRRPSSTSWASTWKSRRCSSARRRA